MASKTPNRKAKPDQRERASLPAHGKPAPAVKYPPHVPEVLRQLHESHGVHASHELLGALLKSERMTSTWNNLSHHITTEDGWLRLWREIRYAFHLAKRPESPRKQQADHFKTIAAKVADLRSSIHDSVLDMPLYDVLPPDVLSLLYEWLIQRNVLSTEIRSILPGHRQLHWKSLDSVERADLAHRLLPWWPCISDFLEQIEDLAKAHAITAITKPRVTERHTGPPREFLTILSAFFIHAYGQPLWASAADVAAVLFGDDDIDENKAEKLVRGKRGK